MIISDLNYIEVVSNAGDVEGSTNSPTAFALALAGAKAKGSSTYTATVTGTYTAVYLK